MGTQKWNVAMVILGHRSDLEHNRLQFWHNSILNWACCCNESKSRFRCSCSTFHGLKAQGSLLCSKDISQHQLNLQMTFYLLEGRDNTDGQEHMIFFQLLNSWSQSHQPMRSCVAAFSRGCVTGKAVEVALLEKLHWVPLFWTALHWTAPI